MSTPQDEFTSTETFQNADVPEQDFKDDPNVPEQTDAVALKIAFGLPVALPNTTSPEQTAAGLDPNRDITAPEANSVGDTVDSSARVTNN